MFLIGKLVRDLVISQVLLKTPDFEQAVEWWDHRCDEELFWKEAGKTLSSGFAWFPDVKSVASPSSVELGLKYKLLVD